MGTWIKKRSGAVGGIYRRERLEELYERVGPLVFGRCRRILKDPDAAADITHELFVRLMDHLGNLPTEEDVLRWSYRVATNLCLNQIRNTETRRRLAVHIPVPRLQLEDDVLDRRTAEDLLRKAPEHLREVAVLHFIDGLMQSEVGELLGVSRRTVINRLNRFTQWARAECAAPISRLAEVAS